MAKQCGIYCFRNIHNGKRYVGQSINIQARRSQHLSDLKRGAHRNSFLQRAYNLHGEAAFEFTVLEEVPQDMLDMREVAWIGYYVSNNDLHGYNLDSGGNRQKQISVVTRAKMSAAKKGVKRHPFSPETIAKMRSNALARSVELKAKIGAARKGLKHTAEAIAKMRSSHAMRHAKKRNPS